MIGATCHDGLVPDNMRRVEHIVAELPEAQRVDVAAWDGQPTFRVRKKTFIFTDAEATSLTVKLDLEEAQAVAASDPDAEAAGYGLGRSGWVKVQVTDPDEERWAQLREWIRMSYVRVAPKTLGRAVEATDGLS
jgi:predicted DNA-binding protein (MmcQ/YjbR family)